MDLGTIRYNVDVNTAAIKLATEAIQVFSKAASGAGVSIANMGKKSATSMASVEALSKKTNTASSSINNLSTETATASAQIDRMRHEAIRAGLALDTIRNNAIRTSQAATVLRTETTRTTTSMGAMASAAKFLGISLAGIGAYLIASTVINYADAWNRVENVLKGVTETQTDLYSTQSKIIQLSKDTYSALEGTSRLYAEITRSSKDLGVNQERVIGVTRTINNLFLAGGRSAATAAGAITQLNQGFASGVLRGDEFNSVAEGAPRILDAVAQHLNMTRGALRDFAATGGVTAKILIGALESYSDEAQRAADRTRISFGQNSELAKTFALEFVESSSVIKGFGTAAGEGLVFLAKNLETITIAASALAVVMGGKLVSSMAAASVQRVNAIATASAQAKAEQNVALGIARRAEVEALAAKEALAKARADNVAATAAVNAARANGLATQSIASLLVAQESQVLAQRALTAAVTQTATATEAASLANANLARTNAAVAATGAMATAVRGLGAAYALIGGPVGLAVIAAAGIYYYFTRATEAEKITDSLGDSVESIAEKFQDLGAAQQELARQDYALKIEDQKSKIEDLNEKLDRFNKLASHEDAAVAAIRMKYYGQTILETKAEIEGATAELNKLQKIVNEITPPTAEFKGFTGELGLMEAKIMGLGNAFLHAKTGFGVMASSFRMTGVVDAVKEVESYVKATNDVNRAIALSGDTSKLAAFNYDVLRGKMNDWSADQIESHRALLAQEDYLSKASERKASELEKQKEYYDRLNASIKEHISLMATMESEINASIDKSFEGSMTNLGISFDDALESSKSLDDMIKKTDELGGAWSRTGSIVVDAFGSIADSINDYTKRMEEIQKLQEEADRFKPANALDEIKNEKLKIKLAEESTKAQISGYGKMAGAAAMMFKENTKGRKAMHAVETTLAATEIAMVIKNTATELALSVKRIAAYSAETGVSLAAGAAKMFAQSGWAGFAGVAAMIATMAALGFSGGGSGGASAKDIQETQGTGTSLGDSSAKSESIVNAFESFADIEVDQLAELRGIRSAMNSLSDGIKGLAISMVRGNKFEGTNVTGLGSKENNMLGKLFGSTTKKLKDTGLQIGAQELGSIMAGDFEAFYYDTIETTKKTLFGLRKKVTVKEIFTSADIGLEKQISGILGYLGAAVSESLDVLGIDAASAIEKFQVNIGKISFKDLNGEEIQAELEAIFGEQGDLLATYVLPQIEEYQRMGEGAFETLMRVSKEQAIFNDALENMGVSLGSMSNLMRLDVAQSIINLMGGLEKFSSKTSAYFDKFFSEDEKIKMLGDSLSEAFGSIGESVPATHAAFRAIVDGIDYTSEAGQQLFASLMELSPALDQYIKATDKAAEATKSLTDQRIKEEKSALEAVYGSLKSTADAEKKRIESIVGAASTAKTKLDQSIANEKSILQKQHEEKVSLIKSQADAEIEVQKAINKARKDEHDAVSKRIKSLESLFSDLNSSAYDMAIASDDLTRNRRSAAAFEITTALSNARAGRGLPMDGQLSEALDILRNNPSDLYASSSDMAFETAKLQNKLTELAGFAGTQLTTEERTLAALDAQLAAADEYNVTSIAKYDEMIAAANLQYEADVSALNLMAENAQSQFDLLTGIDTKSLSVEDAINRFNYAMLAADFENAQGQYERLDSLVGIGKNQLDAVIGLDGKILSLSEAVIQFTNAVGASESDKVNKELLAQMQRMADEIVQLREAQRKYTFLQLKELQNINLYTRETAINSEPA